MTLRCIYTHTGISITESYGYLRPCCRFKPISPSDMPNIFDVDTLDNIHQTSYFVDIRNSMETTDRLIQQCERCNIHEQHGIRSKRQEGNGYFSTVDIVPGYVQDLEIALDYTCNMMCRMCGPTASSKWNAAKSVFRDLKNKNIKIDSVESSNYKQYADQFRKVFSNTSLKYVRFIKIEGGEPFYSKNLEWFLDKLNTESVEPKQVKLNIFSNGSIFPSATILEKLKNFDTLITFSLDAYGDLASVIRHGVDWKEVELSLSQWAIYARLNNIELCTNTVLSIMNVNMIDPLIHFCNNVGITVYFDNLVHPDYLSMYQLPLHVRQQWQDNYKGISDGKGQAFNELLMANITETANFDKFLHFTEILDKYQGVSFKEHNSEMFNIIQGLHDNNRQ